MKLLVGTEDAPYAFYLDPDTGVVEELTGTLGGQTRNVASSPRVGGNVVQKYTNFSLYSPGDTTPAVSVNISGNNIWDISAHPDGYLVGGSPTSPYIVKINLDGSTEPFPSFDNLPNSDAYALAISPKKPNLIAINDGYPEIYDLETGERLLYHTSNTFYTNALNRISWSPDGRYICFTSYNSYRASVLFSYDEATNEFNFEGEIPTTRGYYVSAFNASSTRLFLGSSTSPYLFVYRITESELFPESFTGNLGSYCYALCGTDDPNVMFAGGRSNNKVKKIVYNPSTEAWDEEEIPYTHVGNTSRSIAVIDDNYFGASVNPITPMPADVLPFDIDQPPTHKADAAFRFSSPGVGLAANLIEKINATFAVTQTYPEAFFTAARFIAEILLEETPELASSQDLIRLVREALYTEDLSLETTQSISLAQIFKDVLSIHAEVLHNLNSEISYEDIIDALDDSVKLEQIISFLDALNIDSESDILHSKVIAFMSSLLAESSSENNVNYAINFVAATLIRSLYKTGYSLEAVSTAELVDSFATKLTVVLDELAALEASSTPTVNVGVQMLVISEAAASDSYETGLRAFVEYQSVLNGLSMFRIGDDLYEGWVLNLNDVADPDIAVSTYTNYPFTSIVEYDGKQYGVAGDGIYLLEGTDDAGTPIPAAVRTGRINFDNIKTKDAKNFYLGYTGDGQVVLKVLTSTGSQHREDWYRIKASGDYDHKVARTKLHRGLRSAYWQFELVDPDGTEFDFDDAVFEYQVLSRRIRK